MNNLVWFFTISLGAGILGAIGVTVWYTEDELGKKFIKKISEDEVKERRSTKKRI